MSIFKDYLISKETRTHILNDMDDCGDLKNGDLAIAVMDRGWVFVGFISFLKDERIRLDCCHNIHYWGTTKGLGEIAIHGPTSDTKLNPCEPIFGKPIFLMKASDKWIYG